MASIRQSALVFVSASLIGLAACSSEKKESAAATETAAVASPASGNLADSLGSARTMADALAKTGLRTVFDDKASYTLLAPGDAAFAALGDKAKALIDAPDHAALAVLVKDHLIPGYVTTGDIEKAIVASKDGKVTMRNLSGGEMTFTKVDGGIQVASADGSKARLAGDPVAAGNSIAIPVDGVLKAM